MYPYPVEILGDTYLTKLGGFSEEIRKNEVGINEKAIEMNTSLIQDESYVRLRFFDIKQKPFFLRKSFKIVGIPQEWNSFELSLNGEIVMAEDYREELKELVGKHLLINAVEYFRIDGDYSSMSKAIKSMREWIWKSESLRRRN
uniref:Uncharacterized protein n=1 Tax=Geoglobus ahangari TaxID=113653 RepID=A0A7C3UH84_9EURY